MAGEPSVSDVLKRRRVKRFRFRLESENPGVVEEIVGEAVPCKEFEWERQRFERNPDRVNLLKLESGLSTLTMWRYRTSLNKAFLAINREFASLDEYDLKSLYLAVREALIQTQKAKRSQNL